MILDFSEIRMKAIFLRTIRNRLTFLSQHLTRCVSQNGLSHASNKNLKPSFSNDFCFKFISMIEWKLCWFQIVYFILKHPVYICNIVYDNNKRKHSYIFEALSSLHTQQNVYFLQNQLQYDHNNKNFALIMEATRGCIITSSLS